MGDGGGSPAIAAPAAGDQCKVMWDGGGLKDKQTSAKINEYSCDVSDSGDSKINLKLTGSWGEDDSNGLAFTTWRHLVDSWRHVPFG